MEEVVESLSDVQVSNHEGVPPDESFPDSGFDGVGYRLRPASFGEAPCFDVFDVVGGLSVVLPPRPIIPLVNQVSIGNPAVLVWRFRLFGFGYARVRCYIPLFRMFCLPTLIQIVKVLVYLYTVLESQRF